MSSDSNDSFAGTIATPIRTARRDFLFLIAGSLVAVTLAIALREDSPLSAVLSTTRALQLAAHAELTHRELLAAHTAGRLTDAEFADRLQNETLPDWQLAADLMDRSRTDGARGRRFDEIARSYQARLTITGTLCTALRTGDEQLLAQSLAAWKDSELVEPALPLVTESRARIGGG